MDSKKRKTNEPTNKFPIVFDNIKEKQTNPDISIMMQYNNSLYLSFFSLFFFYCFRSDSYVIGPIIFFYLIFSSSLLTNFSKQITYKYATKHTHTLSLSHARTHTERESERKRKTWIKNQQQQQKMFTYSFQWSSHLCDVPSLLAMNDFVSSVLCVRFILIFMVYKRSQVTLFYCLPKCEYATGIFYSVNRWQKIAHYLFI